MSNNGLIVRRNERFEISIPARVRVAMNHIDSIQFAKGVTDSDRWISVDVVDFAHGGTGFICETFFARGLDLELEVLSMEEGSELPMLSCSMKVKRVQMTDRRPAYLIGCAFQELEEHAQTDIDSLITRLRGISEEENEGGATHA
jgi:c-di-GMP-binding flagellar brake protein YcgR